MTETEAMGPISYLIVEFPEQEPLMLRSLGRAAQKSAKKAA